MHFACNDCRCDVTKTRRAISSLGSSFVRYLDPGTVSSTAVFLFLSYSTPHLPPSLPSSSSSSHTSSATATAILQRPSPPLVTPLVQRLACPIANRSSTPWIASLRLTPILTFCISSGSRPYIPTSGNLECAAAILSST